MTRVRTRGLAVQEVYVHIAPPRLPRVDGDMFFFFFFRKQVLLGDTSFNPFKLW